MSSMRPAYFSGGIYHFYNRGSHRVSIFRENSNYLFVLRKIKGYTAQSNLTLLSYCLMPNHYHFLVRQNGLQPAGMLPQRVFNSYSKAYNKRYQHSGTLFEGPYQVKQIDQTVHLLHLCRYIHANPVLHGFVTEPGDWPYSNYLEWVRQRDGTLVDHAFIREYFETPFDYVEFVKDYLRTRKLSPEIAVYLKELED